MIYCPTCGKPAGIVETRTPTKGSVRRRYLCRCGHSFSTVEVLTPAMRELLTAAKFLKKVKEMAHA